MLYLGTMSFHVSAVTHLCYWEKINNRKIRLSYGLICFETIVALLNIFFGQQNKKLWVLTKGTAARIVRALKNGDCQLIILMYKKRGLGMWDWELIITCNMLSLYVIVRFLIHYMKISNVAVWYFLTKTWSGYILKVN